MQNPPVNPADMAVMSQIETNSGSTFFAVSVLIVIAIFVIYTVIMPKFNKKNEEI